MSTEIILSIDDHTQFFTYLVFSVIYVFCLFCGGAGNRHVFLSMLNEVRATTEVRSKSTLTRVLYSEWYYLEQHTGHVEKDEELLSSLRGLDTLIVKSDVPITSPFP